MEVFEAIKKRRSIRKYKQQEIPKEDLEIILESARLAPSGHNGQRWRFIVVRDPERKKLITDTSGKIEEFMVDAACIVVCLAETDPDLTIDCKLKQQVIIAIEHMVLTAESLGYGTCWVGTMDRDKVKEICGVPKHKWAAVDLLPIGVPDESPKARPRKPFTEIFYDEDFGKSLIL